MSPCRSRTADGTITGLLFIRENTYVQHYAAGETGATAARGGSSLRTRGQSEGKPARRSSNLNRSARVCLNGLPMEERPRTDRRGKLEGMVLSNPQRLVFCRASGDSMRLCLSWGRFCLCQAPKKSETSGLATSRPRGGSARGIRSCSLTRAVACHGFKTPWETLQRHYR